MDSNKIEVIDHKAIIKIEFSGSFYKSVQNAMIHLSSYREAEELTALIAKLNNSVPDEDFDDWEALCRRCHMKGDGRMENLINVLKNKTPLTIQRASEARKRYLRRITSGQNPLDF